MLRLSKLSDYAIVVLSRLSDDGPPQTAIGIAGTVGLPEPTVSKVLKLLVNGSLAVSQRGARGGYHLARPLDAISVADVVTAIDGPLALVACVEGSIAPCEAECFCPVRGRWDPVNAAVHKALASLSIATIAASQPRPARAIPARAGAPSVGTHAAVPQPVPVGS